MERNGKFKKFGDRTSKGNKKKKIKCIKKVMGCCSSYLRAATRFSSVYRILIVPKQANLHVTRYDVSTLSHLQVFSSSLKKFE